MISKLQTIDSGDRFWKLVSDEPFEKVKADPRELLAMMVALKVRIPRMMEPAERRSLSRCCSIAIAFCTIWVSRVIAAVPALLALTAAP